MKRTSTRFLVTLAVFVLATVVADQGAVVAEGKGETGPRACRVAPHPHGFWHSECFETSTEKGGAGGGTSAPKEKDFAEKIIPAADALLEENMSLESACVDGMNAGPRANTCQLSVRYYTALMFNIASGKVDPECEITLATQGCGSTTVAEAVDELAALIKTKEVSKCTLASMCAKAINEGHAFRISGL
jgi:hypothetical protein